MVLQISHATPADVDRIASVHLAAFDFNILLHAQFPTPASLASLKTFLVQEMLHSIENLEASRKVVLVVRDSEAIDQIISFAKWDLPGIQQNHPVEVSWHEDVNQGFLKQYYNLAEAAKDRVVGKEKCYRMTFLGTDPLFQGRGAATLLIKWGIEKAKQDKLPIYLESTIAAASLYRRLGFIAVDGLCMPLPGRETDSQPKVYQELSMLKVCSNEETFEMDHWDSSLNFLSLKMDYDAGITPQQVVQAIYDRIEAYKEVQPSLWLHLQPIGAVMISAHALYTRWPDPDNRPPLWGIPFSVKDSINVAGIPTTIGCPALTFIPNSSAAVFEHCVDAGGLFIGKTNMEQLATGMTGCRSPYGTLHSTFSKYHIVGGSSSGSAVTVSEGLVSFSLGSDTAGSIRVPALYNGIVGYKPTKGTISARGVYPACQHQDCVSFLAITAEDTESVWKVCKGFDRSDFFAKRISSSDENTALDSLKFKFGVPPEEALNACSPQYKRKFNEVVESLTNLEDGNFAGLDWAPFASANELLYGGSFVLERLTILPEGWFDKNKQLLHPVTREVFEGALARNSTAVDLFRDLHKQAEFKRAVEDILTFEIDTSANKGVITVMVVPTAPFHPTIEEVERDPVGLNGQLGAFAHFANVLDLVAIAMPCGTYEIDDKEFEERKMVLPFGVTILGGCGLDQQLLMLAKRLEEVLGDL
ncbi:hypothetical protein G7Y89_g2126 [Cudoniella acicularis]|uniref:N-acetyltransferase domain-containing protein n=1 Tax=Cudoniella acicularis TaxID=354080 RepID=A0A8H4W796_9HELO|nr:hypothetical protein G7Y89_g2126 [Cudoniella acicularis]